jgi:hypothetical protein
MTEKFKEKLMKYMSGRLKILSRDSETCLTYNWIQDGIFEKLLATCKRKEFFKFCRVVGPNYDDRSDQGEEMKLTVNAFYIIVIVDSLGRPFFHKV